MSDEHVVDRCHDLSYEEFDQTYLQYNKPVVITDALKEWPATGKWSLDYFKSQFGDREVKCRESDEPTTMAAYIDNLPNSTLDHPVPYLRNIEIQTGFPELTADIMPRLKYVSPNWLSNPLMPPNWTPVKDINQFFLSGKGTKIRLHFDDWMAYNIISNLIGVKRVLLFHPDNGKYLYPDPDNLILSQIFDIYNVDTEKYPLIKEATSIEVDVGPGESIFIPAGWWHSTLTIEDCISVSSEFVSKWNWGIFAAEVSRVFGLKYGPIVGLGASTYLALVGMAMRVRYAF